MSETMDEIGRLYEEGEYSIAEMLVAADIFKRSEGNENRRGRP